MSQNFSALSNGLMSYLASRSHDWLAWQLEEDDRQLKISLLSRPSDDGNSSLIETVVPLEDSPSRLLEDILAKISIGQGIHSEKLPKVIFRKYRNSFGDGAGENI